MIFPLKAPFFSPMKLAQRCIMLRQIQSHSRQKKSLLLLMCSFIGLPFGGPYFTSFLKYIVNLISSGPEEGRILYLEFAID